MQHIEDNFKGVRNLQIYYQAWLPAGAVKAVLLVIHGIGEHSGRYSNVADYFVPLGYAVYALDHIGHGKSAGRREFVDRFTDFTDTLAIYLKFVAGWQEGKPIFILGHSMGGTIALTYLLDHQRDFTGALISAPAVMVGQTITPVTITLGKILARLAPRLGLISLDANALSRDLHVVEAYLNDPLVFHGKTPARLGAELLSAMQRITAGAGRLTLPLLVLQGAADTLVDPAGAQMLYEKAGSSDKTIRIYDGLYHEVFNEPEREHVLKDVEEWLAART